MSDVKRCDGPGCDAHTKGFGHGTGWYEVDLNRDWFRRAVDPDSVTLHFHDTGCLAKGAETFRDTEKVRSDDA